MVARNARARAEGGRADSSKRCLVTTHLEATTGRGITDMSDLVTRLRTHANAFGNLDFWSGREPSREEAAIINDLREAVDRIANLELALVELSQTSGAPSNVANANALASRVRWAARRALEYRP
jgi:hypothetical protein